ncbi:hypothetical protein [Patulibacter defluvii]|uniref:hypothetical protein n=1 Tax=Patulibacter defluvii TaxID=3095358 RepID=UPI002A7636CA|nr:hypothetical protein [Patulibacter sp. DM4]
MAVACVLAVAVVAVVAALLVDHVCTHAPPPLAADARPVPGSARASYCDAADRWLLLVAAPVLAVALASTALRRRPPALAAATVLVSAALLANAVLAGSLDPSLTI